MKAKYTSFLPVFLCLILLFRMCFLSFGYAPPTNVRSHYAAGSGKGLLAGSGMDGKYQKHDTSLQAVVLKASKTNRAVQNKRLRLSFLYCFTHNFYNALCCKLYVKADFLEIVYSDLLLLKRHIFLSVLRI